VRTAIISLHNLLADDRLDVDRSKRKIIEHFGLLIEGQSTVSIVAAIGRNRGEMKGGRIIQLVVRYACCAKELTSNGPGREQRVYIHRDRGYPIP
jgi:hypothetical protein